MLNLKPVEKRADLNRESFAKEYLTDLRPVVFSNLMNNWPGKEKWTIDFFKENYGDLLVPVYETNVTHFGEGYMEPRGKIPFKEYLETIEKGPTNLRMFLFNIFRHVPELTNDFSNFDIMDGFYDNFPYMFFGGEGSTVTLHYDVDLSHVFLNQLHGRKRVVLIPPQFSKAIYQHPFTVASYIDVNNPDYEKFPALKKVWGYECVLEPGETLFMPSGHWHYIEYLDGGYSISLRANESVARRVKGVWNIARHYVVDKGMNKLMGEKWLETKKRIAQRRAEEGLFV